MSALTKLLKILQGRKEDNKKKKKKKKKKSGVKRGKVVRALNKKKEEYPMGRTQEEAQEVLDWKSAKWEEYKRSIK